METSKLKRRIIYVLCAVIFLVAGFVGGFVCAKVTHTSSSYEWVVNTIKNNYYEDISEEEMANYSIQGISKYLLDDYSTYYTKAEYASLLSSNKGNKSGIGISPSYINTSFGKGIYVNSVVGNSPAYNCGLKAGTFIYSGIYKGVQTDFDSSQSFYDFVATLCTGDNFTFVTDRGNFELAKDNYTASYCFMATNSVAWDCTYDSGKLKVAESTTSDKVISYLPEGCAYLSLSQFYGNAKQEFAELIEKFNTNNCTSLILDLRNNGGGYVEVMQYISSLFTTNRTGASSVAMTAKYKSGKEEEFAVKKYASSDSLLSEDTKVYILANCNTASASEALMGVLLSNGVVDYSDIYLSNLSDEYVAFTGTTKNNRTYGKGIMQSYFTNPTTGEVLKLTTAKIYWPNGKTIHDTGITLADGCKSVNAQWIKTYSDEELQSAVKAIWG